MSPSRRSDGAGDPYQWLEEVEGARADAWVRAANARAEAALVDAAFEADRAAILAVLDSDQRIPHVRRRGDLLYNLWEDARNRRGLWRRTTVASYRTAAPDWETVIDIDALAAAEGRPWKFHGALACPQDLRRALVHLSPGGSDAAEVREFDLVDKRFVGDGFKLPEAKSWVSWVDADTLLVGHPVGEAHTTTSGYARTVRRWRRGQPIEAAEVIFACAADHMVAHAEVEHAAAEPYTLIIDRTDFFHQTCWIDRPGRPRQQLDVPGSMRLATIGDRLALYPREDWTPSSGGAASAPVTVPGGALAVASLRAWLDGRRDLEVLFRPTPRRALDGWVMTPDCIAITIVEDVTGRIEVARPLATGGWEVAALPATPAMATVSVEPLEAGELSPRREMVISTMSATLPPTLSLWDGAGPPEVLKRAPATFEAHDVETVQRWARAADGAEVPYFLTGRRAALAAGPCPTILYGYGGFELTQSPAYLGIAGRVWIERGGLYALANIRGGGEFGPAWHEAGRRARKHVSHDDFAAVARDLAARGHARPDTLACWGGSNGGLLVGNMLVRYPELFGAVVCQVPLLDMARYTRLLAGASWIAEYGDPDDDAEWAFIERFSPYHQVRAGVRYPPVLFTTSRTDDRVHPGHARKMAARLAGLGHEALLWENIEGGHGGAADNTQAAFQRALSYAFLRRTIARTMA